MEKKIINDERSIYLLEKLKICLKNNLRLFALFGSRARGDYKQGSDYDFLIVLQIKNNEILNTIREIEINFLNKYDILSSALIYDEKEWEMRKRIPIGMNIMKEGIFYEC